MNVVAAILYAVAASVLIALGLGFPTGALTPVVAIVALVAGGLVGAVGWYASHRYRSPLVRPRGWQWLPVLLFAWFVFRSSLWLIFRHGDKVSVLSPNNLGDMSLHLTFINYFANGAPLWPDSPIFSAGKMTYAAGSDIFNSLLVLAGLDVVRGLVWAALIGTMLAGFALWRWGGAFALMGFVCSGGLLGFASFAAGPDELFFRDYAGNMVYDWPWKSLPLALLVTQRGFLFALPAGLLLLSSWRERFFGGGDGWRLPWAGELLLYAAMPIFHVHTFIALSVMLAAFFIAHPFSRKQTATFVAAAFVPATVLMWLSVGMFQSNALPMWTDMGSFENPPPRPPTEVLGWQPGWMVNEPQPHFDAWAKLCAPFPVLTPFEAHGRFVLFWLLNFGILPFLAAGATLLLLRAVLRRPIPTSWAWIAAAVFVLVTPLLGEWPAYQTAGFPRLRTNALPLIAATCVFVWLLLRLAKHWHTPLWPAVFMFPALFLFFVCCNVKFAPWAWDNTKLMLWSVVIVLPFLRDLVLSRWPSWKASAAMGLLFFPGFVGLIGGLNSQYQGFPIATQTELDEVAAVTRGIPITETFAAAPEWNHPLLLSGRKLVLGYPGHVDSHGIRFGEQQAKLDALMSGVPEWRIYAAELGARYLFFGSREHQRWPHSREPWRRGASVVFDGAYGALYDLETPPVPVGE